MFALKNNPKIVIGQSETGILIFQLNYYWLARVINNTL